jgi:hypothetical protein
MQDMDEDDLALYEDERNLFLIVEKPVVNDIIRGIPRTAAMILLVLITSIKPQSV